MQTIIQCSLLYWTFKIAFATFTRILNVHKELENFEVIFFFLIRIFSAEVLHKSTKIDSWHVWCFLPSRVINAHYIDIIMVEFIRILKIHIFFNNAKNESSENSNVFVFKSLSNKTIQKPTHLLVCKVKNSSFYQSWTLKFILPYFRMHDLSAKKRQNWDIKYN